jgi:hypothetical protein
MAVQIVKDLTAADIYNGASVFTDYLAGYNSTVVKWSTTTIKTIKTGEIWFNGTLKFVDLIPLNNVVEFDCYEVIKTLFGSFDDFISYQTSDTIKYDGNLFNLHSVKLVVNYTDNTSENVDITGKFTRAVRQHTDMSNGMFYFTGAGAYPPFANLLMKAPSKKDFFTQRIRIFKGYPIDISFIGPTANNYLVFILYNNTMGLTGYDNYTITVPSGSRTNKHVQRIILSDGLNLHSLLAAHPAITKGYFQIDHRVSNVGALTNLYSFAFDIVDECGVYIKWLNSCGGWSYWLFNKNTRNLISTKAKGTISSNAGQLGYAADEKNIGFDSEEKLQVVTQGVEKWELEQLLDIATSPCVYLYLKPRSVWAYENGNSDVWLKLPTISNFKYSKKAESTLYNIGFEFQLPKIYTQTL